MQVQQYPKPQHKRRSTKAQKLTLQHTKACYATGQTVGLESHHCIYGKNRQKADDYGLTVWLVRDYHTGAHGVHNGNHALDLELKQLAQREFEKVYGRQKFYEVFGRYYL